VGGVWRTPAATLGVVKGVEPALSAWCWAVPSGHLPEQQHDEKAAKGEEASDEDEPVGPGVGGLGQFMKVWHLTRCPWSRAPLARRLTSGARAMAGRLSRRPARKR
jgi:hypothetical protein